ncbi:alpha/beta-hydrolase [Auricularia subglabra TFB-10046 SS5]|uniref:Alpha/beta-hydrolase n=1 Tax=Auricularia subglabra (strain TFB-10046 / SS5) TaxID=717982 RepID=J0D8B6_AURST|nr:alpha/beta-hydrolase [Auricularia subglabra TFB-10046 SS5]
MPSFIDRYGSFYKDAKTSRGKNYHYLAIAPSDATKPTLLFIHGFPSTSQDWHFQIEYFHAKGYGLIVPDLLGYGGTDKPSDTAEYNLRLMAQDVVDLVDHEKAERAVAIGHDWGSALLSRVAVYHQERFIAFAWFALSFMSPVPQVMPFDVMLPWLKQNVGVELFAYQEFFLQPGAAKIIEDNVEGFIDVMCPADPALWKEVMTVRGALAEWAAKSKRAPRAEWLLPEDLERIRKTIANNGLEAPINWYRGLQGGFNTEDEQKLAQQEIKISKPVFFGAALQDYIGLADMNKAGIAKIAPNLTVRDFDTGHWVYLEKPDEVNRELGAWLETLA